MKRLTCLLLSAFLCLGNLTAYACTSFAVHSANPIYGLNWDYPDTAAYLRLNKVEDYHKVFSIGFETPYGLAANGSMNDQGFLALVQDEYPQGLPTAAADDKSVEDMHDLASWTPYVFATVQEVRDRLDGGLYVANKYYTMHDLFADSQGDAFILEERAGNNVITPAEKGVLVMTNFPNNHIPEMDMTLSPNTLWGMSGYVGVDRYLTVHQLIAANPSDFGISQGFEALEKAAQNGLYRTRYSGIYVPLKGEVYVVLERDYSHIWKVNMAQDTIETYQGFQGPTQTFAFADLCQGEAGIPFETLIAYANADGSQ